MVKKLAAILLCPLLLLGAAGCGLINYPKTSEQTLYNGYMGLAVHLPAGWYVVERSETNLTDTPEASQEKGNLDIGEYDLLNLISIQNKSLSSNAAHIGIDVYAEDCEMIYPTLKDYVDSEADWIAGGRSDEDKTRYELLDRDETQINGVSFTRLTFLVTLEEGNEYTEEYYYVKTGGMFLTVYANYWNDDAQYRDQARAAIQSMIEVDKDKIAAEEAAQALSTLYNGYLEITLSIPPGQYETQINSTNLTPDRYASEQLDSMEKGSYNDGGYYIDFAVITSSPETADEDYARFDLYAEGYPAFATLDEYLDATVAAMTSEEIAPIRRTLTNRDSTTIEGKQFAHLVFDTTDDDSDTTLTEELYVLQVKELYLIAYLIHNPESPKSQQNAMELLATFSPSIQEALPEGVGRL